MFYNFENHFLECSCVYWKQCLTDIFILDHYVLCLLSVVFNHVCDLFVCRSSMWERTWWSQMSLPQRSTWRGCGGDIWSLVEELESFPELSLLRSTGSKSSCRYSDAHTLELPAKQPKVTEEWIELHQCYILCVCMLY